MGGGGGGGGCKGSLEFKKTVKIFTGKDKTLYSFSEKDIVAFLFTTKNFCCCKFLDT